MGPVFVWLCVQQAAAPTTLAPPVADLLLVVVAVVVGLLLLSVLVVVVFMLRSAGGTGQGAMQSRLGWGTSMLLQLLLLPVCKKFAGSLREV